MASLEDTRSRQQAALDEQTAQREKAEQQAAALDASLAATRAELDQAKQAVCQLEAANTAGGQQLRQLQVELDAARVEGTKQAGRAEAAEGQLAAAQQQVTSLQSEVKTKEASVETLSSRMAAQVSQLLEAKVRRVIRTAHAPSSYCTSPTYLWYRMARCSAALQTNTPCAQPCRFPQGTSSAFARRCMPPSCRRTWRPRAESWRRGKPTWRPRRRRYGTCPSAASPRTCSELCLRQPGLLGLMQTPVRQSQVNERLCHLPSLRSTDPAGGSLSGGHHRQA